MPDRAATGRANGRDAARARRQALARSGANAPGTGASSAQNKRLSQDHSRAAAKVSSSNGRALARERRKALAHGGQDHSSAPMKPIPREQPTSTSSVRPESSHTAPSVPAVPEKRISDASALAGLSGRALSQARRALLAQAGRNALPAGSAASAPRPSRPVKRSGSTDSAVRQEMPQLPAEDQVSIPTDSSVAETDLDVLCTWVEGNTSAADKESMSIRQWCQERRKTLAHRGKRGLPPSERQRKTRSGTGRNGVPPLRGREAARIHREEQCRNGRGDSPVCRPTGRLRPEVRDRYQKVEQGSTLSGKTVTGTQVERKQSVTGNEPGSCRTVTGTEYIGKEQYAAFCDRTPAPGSPKVARSVTADGSGVTGTPVGRSAMVSGDEPGACQSITGTEYLGAERFEEFCASKGLVNRAQKVPLGQTAAKGIRITGSDEARQRPITGAEPGSSRSITGSQYADAYTLQQTINGPKKVALTHTVAGRPVSGTDVSTGIRITGDEAGSCQILSGTEYLSTEQFQTRCGSTPPPAFSDVGMDRSRKGLRITGNLVDRSENVTGNEPGSCQRVTGSQYGEPRLCGGGVDKVETMSTLHGTAVTGSRVGRSPKSTGDEQGGCEPVTGTEYFGREQYDRYCESTPAVPASKVEVSVSPRGLPVSGPPMGRSDQVTGNEPGSTLHVSGTPYVGREQLMPESRVSAGSAPAPGVLTQRFVAPPEISFPIPEEMPDDLPPPAPHSFSIMTPARAGRDRRERITGTGMGASHKITGPVNKANGLVSGTPEFRHGDEDRYFGSLSRNRNVFPSAPTTNAPPPPPVAIAVGEDPPVEPLAALNRITGEGSDSGPRITGDDWARSDRVTGTEGRWAQSRNPTQRGIPRDMGANARLYADRERPEVPPARITGCSGNYGQGPVVTVSGGARG